MDILRLSHISKWNSEHYHQSKNPAQWRYRTTKSWTNIVMNRSGAPANCWLLCLIYVLPSQPHSLCSSRWQNTPFALTGITPDMSIILLFTFYQPTHDQHFPSESGERAGYWVGFGEHCGDAMTHKLLDHETQKYTYRSAVRPQKSSTPNHRHQMEGRFLHLLTLLKIKFPLDHHWEPQKVPHQITRPLQSSSGLGMKRIHLNPSLCLPLTPQT